MNDLNNIISNPESTPEQVLKAKELIAALAPKPEPKQVALPQVEDMSDAELEAAWGKWNYDYKTDVCPVDAACEILRRRKQ